MIINPILLWFLPLAALPIIIHLLTRLRVRTVELPTFRFLLDSYTQQRRRLRIVEWLLLILRTCFVILLVAAVARPVADRWASLFGSEGRDIVLILDAGANMDLRSSATTSLQRARLAAEAVVSRLSPADHLTVIRAGRTPAILLDRFNPDLQQLSALLREPPMDAADPTRPDLPAALALADQLERHGPRATYLITDQTRAGWAALLRDSTVPARPAGSDDDLIVLNVGAPEPLPNLGLVGTAPSAEPAVANLPIRLNAVVEAGHLTEPLHSSVSLIVNGKQVASRNLILESGERRSVPFVYTPDRPGVLEARFELPPDPFDPDNVFRFALNVRGRVNVAAVIPVEPRPGTPDPRLYLDAALNAPLLVLGNTPQPAPLAEQRQIAQSLTVNYLTEDQLREENLRSADVLILADTRIDRRRGEVVRRFLNGGGGVLIFPGPATRAEDVNRSLLQPLGLNISLGDPVGDTADESAAVAVTRFDARHPILHAFDEADARYFATSLLLRRFPIAASPTNPSGATTQQLLQSADGLAAAIAAESDRGRLLLFAFPLTPDWSNLPLKPEFVPLLLRSIAHAAGSQLIQVIPDIKPFDPAPIALSGDWADSPTPTITAIAPDQSRTTLTAYPELSQLRAAFVGADEPGYYRFHVAAQREGGTRLAERGFAVNVNVAPADLTPVQVEAAAAALGEGVTFLTPSSDDPTLAGQLTHRREVWRTLIFITLAVIGLEFILSTLSTTRAAAARATGPIPAAAAQPPASSRNAA